MAQFPKWVYAKGGKSKIVENPDEYYKLGPGWYEAPVPDVPEDATPEQKEQLNSIEPTRTERPRKKLLGRVPGSDVSAKPPMTRENEDVNK